MAFSEKLKLEVKRKAAFRCCRCHEVGIDVHHIIPQASPDNGPDNLKNAAPLCQNCHDKFDGNPNKRKEIRQIRDWWYEVVQEKYYGQFEKFGKINDLILQTQKRHSSSLDELKNEIKLRLDELQNKLGKTYNRTGVIQSANELIVATKLAERLYANVHCKNCGTNVGLMIGSDSCPTCGVAI